MGQEKVPAQAGLGPRPFVGRLLARAGPTIGQSVFVWPSKPWTSLQKFRKLRKKETKRKQKFIFWDVIFLLEPPWDPHHSGQTLPDGKCMANCDKFKSFVVGKQRVLFWKRDSYKSATKNMRRKKQEVGFSKYKK